VPGHRLAPKAYREWEYEGRFESGPPPLYEPDYRPEYADGTIPFARPLSRTCAQTLGTRARR
jgi:hypothetical protein